MFDKRDIENRFKHHPPTSGKTINAHEAVRTFCLDLANNINKLVPDSREKSLALTKLEEVMMWSNAGIARESEKQSFANTVEGAKNNG
jgi:hypothetical protein